MSQGIKKYQVGEVVFYPTKDGMYLQCTIHATNTNGDDEPKYYVSNWTGYQWVSQKDLTKKKPDHRMIWLPV